MVSRAVCYRAGTVGRFACGTGRQIDLAVRECRDRSRVQRVHADEGVQANRDQQQPGDYFTLRTAHQRSTPPVGAAARGRT